MSESNQSVQGFLTFTVAALTHLQKVFSPLKKQKYRGIKGRTKLEQKVMHKIMMIKKNFSQILLKDQSYLNTL